MMILTTPLAVFAVVACVEGFDFAFGGGVELRYDLLTEAPLIQTAFMPGPGLFGRQACPSGYVTHLCKNLLVEPFIYISRLTLTF
jgi:hypothetical protein